jgi:hypothetical protein
MTMTWEHLRLLILLRQAGANAHWQAPETLDHRV